LPTLTPLISLLGVYIFTKSFFLARKSLPHVSSCSDDAAVQLLQKHLGLTRAETETLIMNGILSSDNIISSNAHGRRGCWMDRSADAIAVIVVDALRFDFALEHLPKSIGSRLKKGKEDTTRSKLFRFVADPPTVTMQRLKGLTTGGLPAFADISNSFGGATVEEDTWVQQMKVSPTFARRKRMEDGRSFMAFVGDDTWVDLFPNQFDESHPFPSFNTRDLDTVDNGCLEHLPRLFNNFGPPDKDKSLLKSLNHIARYGTNNKQEKNKTAEHNGSSRFVENMTEHDYFELIVVHFLGVDHVGHTYGPNNFHMQDKLAQIDLALAEILNRIDSATKTCEIGFIFGDHGMTNDGNHGGGTEDETNAGLFAHFSPGCAETTDVSGSELGLTTEQMFRSIHQIDLVPTISILLGLPIPFANIGGLVPALIPFRSSSVPTAHVATSLALNAAQVWQYLTTYSSATNSLSLEAMKELKELLYKATMKYKNSLFYESSEDSLGFREACALYKVFLSEATALGKRLWTTFDTKGMVFGILITLFSFLLDIPFVLSEVRKMRGISLTECCVAFLLMMFQCALLTFSNSYIESEQSIIMFSLSILCVLLSARRGLLYVALSRHPGIIRKKDARFSQMQNDLFDASWMLLFVPCCSRLGEIFVAGHGMDPSIRRYAAHNPLVFISSLAALSFLRIKVKSTQKKRFGLRFEFLLRDVCDLFQIVTLGLSWVEKRSSDVARNGYLMCRISIVLSLFCLAISILRPGVTWIHSQYAVIMFQYMSLLMALTGPSSGSSTVLFLLQIWALHRITKTIGLLEVHNMILAALWRMCTRHMFFATGHACSFNRLQFSAAFVATDVFYFQSAGVSLFLNTFGWEILGNCLVGFASIVSRKESIWKWFCFFQLIEVSCSCISVSLMRRHLMVWAIFAPRFVFAVIFSSFTLFIRLCLVVFFSKTAD